MNSVTLHVLAAQPQVIEPPSSQTLPLGANATFTCRTIGTVRWEIDYTSSSLSTSEPVLEVEVPFAAQGIYATGTLVNSSTTEYFSTLTLTTDGRNETEVYCRARLSSRISAVGQPATVILFGECIV